MSYGRFAEVYDRLMADLPYDEWTTLVEQHCGTEGTLLDLGCGTGEWTIRIAQRGFDVTGVDLSPSMLSIAAEKARLAGQSIQFVEQDMAELEGFSDLDVVTIFCDSLNYLESDDAVVRTFERVYGLLKEGGTFLFDVHSVFKINELFIDQTFTYDDGDVAYIWNSFAGEEPDSVEHELSFFVLDDPDTDRYQRFDELHRQRTYPVDRYLTWLEQAGFRIEAVTADFSDRPPAAESERIFFICKK